MNKIIVKNIDVKDNKICVRFDVSGSDEWLNCFVEPYEDVIEYNVNVAGTPDSVAVIPFVSNLLPVIWLFDAELCVDELDEEFCNCIQDVKKGFCDMYYDYKFGGKVTANKLIKNHSESDKSLVLFSGGVDAFHTVISHIDEKPYLASVWGADMYIDNVNGWANIEAHIKDSAEKLNLESIIIKSNFREYLSYSYLTDFVKQVREKVEWYHDFQHGPVLICLTAPLAYTLGIGKVYIASSFSPELIGNYTCASDPTMDNYYHFCDTNVIHFGFEYNRQGKIHEICEFNSTHNNIINLRVCWNDYNGGNCCLCEKCIRTSLAIIAEGKNPADYGFTLYNDEIRAQMLEKLKKKYRPQFQYNRYFCIQELLKKTYTYKSCPDDLKWFYKLKLHRKQPLYFKLYKSISPIIKKIIKI